MTERHDNRPASEIHLLKAARAGDESAVIALYRDHADAAIRLATMLAGPTKADDLVAESFERILALLQNGQGPDRNFRGYFLATVRARHVDAIRRTAREAPASDQPWLFDAEVPGAEELLEAPGTATAALATLSPRSRQVLWYLEVEARRPAEVARLMNLSPNAVSALAYRAREQLRHAYLDQLVDTTVAAPSCAPTRAKLSQLARGTLSDAKAEKVNQHLDGCNKCSAAYLLVITTNERIAASALPVLLAGISGLSAAGLSAAGLSAVGATVIPGPAWISHTLGRLRDLVGTGGLSSTVAAACTAVAVGLGATSAAVNDPADSATPGIVSEAGTGRPTREAPERRPYGPPMPSSVVEPVGRRPPAPNVDDRQTATPMPVRERREPFSGQRWQAASVPRTDSPERRPRRVQPTPPTVDPITECGTEGDIRLPSTPGITYALIDGNGSSGRWVVVARANEGYVLTTGSQHRFSGDLGTAYPCPMIRSVTLARSDNAWSTLTAEIDATGDVAYELSLTFQFDDDTILRDTATGWTCQTVDRRPNNTDGLSIRAGDRLSCRISYDGAEAVPALRLAVRARCTSIAPTGTASLSSEGARRQSLPF